MFNLTLGQKVRDTVTGFTGIVTGHARYLSYDDQCLVESLDTTGRPIEQWISEKRLAKYYDTNWEE